jgi:hypothetical protein
LSMKIYVKEMSEQGHYYPYMYLLSPVWVCESLL